LLHHIRIDCLIDCLIDCRFGFRIPLITLDCPLIALRFHFDLHKMIAVSAPDC